MKAYVAYKNLVKGSSGAGLDFGPFPVFMPIDRFSAVSVDVVL